MAGKGPSISWVRGDSAPKQMTVTQGGAAFDFTGLTNMEIVVNSEDEPTDETNEQFRMPVAIVNAPGTDGIIEFQPVGATPALRKTAAEAYVPGEFFYDLQVDDGATERVTLFLAGDFAVLQDINKQ